MSVNKSLRRYVASTDARSVVLVKHPSVLGRSLRGVGLGLGRLALVSAPSTRAPASAVKREPSTEPFASGTFPGRKLVGNFG